MPVDRCSMVARVAMCGVLGCALAPPAASAATTKEPDVPRLVSVHFKDPPVAGRKATLQVRATDARHPVSTLLVAYADSIFGESACRPRNSRGHRPPNPFRSQSTVDFSVDHVFSLGTQPLGVLVGAMGCQGRSGGALARPFAVTAVDALSSEIGTLIPGIAIAMPAGVETAGTGTGTNGNGNGTGNGNGPDLTSVFPGAHALPPTSGKDGTKAQSAAAGAAQDCEGADLVPTAATLPLARRATLCLVNRERASRGLRLLHSNPRLTGAASGFASLMVNVGFFDHRGPDGSLPVTRMKKAGYIRRNHYWRVAENVGFGQLAYASPRAIVDAWMQSTSHRTNMLDRGFREMGIGIAQGVPIDRTTPGATYTTDFGVIGKR